MLGTELSEPVTVIRALAPSAAVTRRREEFVGRSLRTGSTQKRCGAHHRSRRRRRRRQNGKRDGRRPSLQRAAGGWHERAVIERGLDGNDDGPAEEMDKMEVEKDSAKITGRRSTALRPHTNPLMLFS